MCFDIQANDSDLFSLFFQLLILFDFFSNISLLTNLGVELVNEQWEMTALLDILNLLLNLLLLTFRLSPVC